MSELVFKKIVNGNIFTKEYELFEKNNIISFDSKNISVIYGPNGTGKSSLIKVLDGEGRNKTLFELMLYHTLNANPLERVDEPTLPFSPLFPTLSER